MWFSDMTMFFFKFIYSEKAPRICGSQGNNFANIFRSNLAMFALPPWSSSTAIESRFVIFILLLIFFARNILKGWNFSVLVMALCFFYVFDKFLKLYWICGKIDRNDVEENANYYLD